jgi:hypothetical protein
MLEENECEVLKVNDIVIDFYSVTHKSWSKQWRGWRWVVDGVTYAQRENSKQILVYQKLPGQISLWRFDVAKTDLLQSLLSNEGEFAIELGSCWKKVEEDRSIQTDIDTSGNEHKINAEIFYILQTK